MPCGLFHQPAYRKRRPKYFQTLSGSKCWLAGFLDFSPVSCRSSPTGLSQMPSIPTCYQPGLVIIFMIYVIGAHGLNILTGFTGQISLGHGAFMGVGAYTAGILAVRYNLPFYVLTLPAWPDLMTAAVGMIFGIPSLQP